MSNMSDQTGLATPGISSGLNVAVVDVTRPGGDGYIRAETRPPPSAPAAAAASDTLPQQAQGTPAGGGAVAAGGGGSSPWDQSAFASSSGRAKADGMNKQHPTTRKKPFTTPTPTAVLDAAQPLPLPRSSLKPYNAAVFYSECHLAGISPKHAERAIGQASEQYQRWWVEALRRGSASQTGPDRMRRGSSSGGVGGDDSSQSSVGGGDDGGGGGPSPRFGPKRSKKLKHSPSSTGSIGSREGRRGGNSMRQRAAVREVIDRVTRRQEEQGGGYLSPPTAPNYPSGYSSSASVTVTTSAQDKKDTAVDVAVVSSNPTSAAATTDESSGSEEVALPNHPNIGGGFGALSLSPNVSVPARRRAMEAKSALLSSLASTGGDVKNSVFLSALPVLEHYYRSMGTDARARSFRSQKSSSPSRLAQMEGLSGNNGASASIEGTWLSLSRPDYTNCLGKNASQHFMYTLGRMSFDMFRPTNLRCSIQGEFNTVRVIDETERLPEYVPRRLRKEVLRCQYSGGRLMTYNIILAFVIEPNQDRHGNDLSPEGQDADGKKGVKDNGDMKSGEHPRHRHRPIARPIRGIMTNVGYMLPDPSTPNRLSVWFAEGSLEVNDEESDLDEWRRIFDCHGAPKRALRERAHMLAAKLFLGASAPDRMEEDGTMVYELKRPIGGHGMAYTDVLFLDDDLRILRGHHGQVYVCARVLTGENVAALQQVTKDSAVEGSNGPVGNGTVTLKGSAFQVSV
eukprot:CAMPEP_0178723880 /NCGR_PEP_ID=MMETSP0699-20121125/25797_1 /TAXON_ID=265572 /ORGANISM="Extubocellulus spinifer, Strain CCMP396" /LENGTH=737 /DNA_ID=CAMNT_0020375019 /DNA_START=1140 /DNA_END=3353 /DNA_ORIENTATION=+